MNYKAGQTVPLTIRARSYDGLRYLGFDCLTLVQ